LHLTYNLNIKTIKPCSLFIDVTGRIKGCRMDRCFTSDRYVQQYISITNTGIEFDITLLVTAYRGNNVLIVICS